MADNDGYAPNPSNERFQNLVDAEFSASQNSPNSSGETAEQNTLAEPNRWDTAVTGRGNKNNGKNTGFKGFVRKRLPTILIIAALLGGGGAIIGSSSMQGFAIVNRLIQEYNSMGTVSDVRSNFLMRRILNVSPELDADDPVRGTVFDYDNFKLGETELAAFKSNNMDIVEVDSGDGPLRYIAYVDGDTTYKITGDADSAAKLGDAIDINTAKANVPDFDTKFTTASATYSGQNAGWYDRLTSKLLARLGLGRNRFDGERQTNNAEADMERFKETANTNQETKGIDAEGEKWDYDEDEEDWFLSEEVRNRADTDSPLRTDTEAEISRKLNAKAGDIAKGANAGVNAGCTLMTIVGTINDLANAAELIQILNFTNGFMEATQKVQAGLGSDAPMGEYLTLLNTRDATKKTGMEAAGMKQLFGGTFNTAEESAKNFNFESSHHSLFNGKVPLNGTTMDEVRECNYARGATAGFSLAADAMALALAPATGGASLGLWVIKIAASTAVSLAVSGIVEALLPRAAAMITRDLITGAVGPDLGNALTAGGRAYMGGNHKQRGGGGASEQAVAAFNQETAAVIAHQAEYERATKSPFDASSQYTFLGSLYASLLPLATSTSLSSSLSSLSSVTNTSFSSLLPSAAAATLENTTLTNQKGDCPISEEVGVMSDMFCSPIIVSDVSTFRIDPAEIFKKVLSLGGFKMKNDTEPELDENNNPVIDTHSNLGKFIAFCGQRQPNYGYADASVTSALTSTGNTIFDNLINGIANAIDAVGSVQDIMEAAINEENSGWISGLYCVNTPQNEKWAGEMRYYQRYIEDQGIMEGMGIVEKSSLEVALDEWYEEHPIDNSYAGQLAYFSGHTKEEVQLALDVVEYYNLLAEYSPENMAPLTIAAPAVKITHILLDTSNLSLVKMQEPLVSRTAEFEREVSLRQYKRSVDQSI